ncbi:cell division protein ZapA [Thorsellia kenyensis]|uniref:Cell division protein ZapA n=1 Tax=Thorsellia kenyensis TaxID=1549888 RepID=A0ABV6C6M8_9GAMM
MATQPVNINVFGRSFRVNCPVEQKEALEFSALDLDNRLRELKNRTGVSNIEQLIFIAALNVCHELAEERKKTSEYATNMENRIKALQETIERALMQHASLDSASFEEKVTQAPTHETVDTPPSTQLL